MDAADLLHLQQWFTGYVATFGDLDPEGFRNIRLKEDHTHRVVSCMQALAEGEGLAEDETLLACAVALLHDVGRFPQYRRWRTFRDSVSENHAQLSLQVIRDAGLLEKLPSGERLLIEEAIRFHNLLALPAQFSSPTDLYIRLIRDADKLDIWRVFMDYYQLPEEQRASAVGLGFPDPPEVTQACLDALAEGKVVRLEQARVLNDFKLLQISWVYDLNFTTTRQLLLEREYLTQLASTLPANNQIQSAVTHAISLLTVSCGQA